MKDKNTNRPMGLTLTSKQQPDIKLADLGQRSVACPACQTGITADLGRQRWTRTDNRIANGLPEDNGLSAPLGIPTPWTLNQGEPPRCRRRHKKIPIN